MCESLASSITGGRFIWTLAGKPQAWTIHLPRTHTQPNDEKDGRWKPQETIPGQTAFESRNVKSFPQRDSVALAFVSLVEPVKVTYETVGPAPILWAVMIWVYLRLKTKIAEKKYWIVFWILKVGLSWQISWSRNQSYLPSKIMRLRIEVWIDPERSAKTSREGLSWSGEFGHGSWKSQSSVIPDIFRGCLGPWRGCMESVRKSKFVPSTVHPSSISMKKVYADQQTMPSILKPPNKNRTFSISINPLKNTPKISWCLERILHWILEFPVSKKCCKATQLSLATISRSLSLVFSLDRINISSYDSGTTSCRFVNFAVIVSVLFEWSSKRFRQLFCSVSMSAGKWSKEI